MKAIANIGKSIPVRDKQLILNALNAVMDIKVIDLDIDRGVLFFQYRNQLALDLLERKLSEIGFPVIAYSYPDRRPLNSRGDGPDNGSLA